MVFDRVVLDLEHELLMIDSIINIYKPFPKDVFIFSKGERFPVMKSSAYSEFFFGKSNKYSAEPTLGWRCIEFVNAYLLDRIYTNKRLEDYTDYYKNRLLPKSTVCKVFYNPYESYDIDIKSLFINYLEFFPTRKEEVNVLNTMLNSIVNKVLTYTNLYPNNIFTLDFSTINTILINGGEIGSYRYREYLNICNLMCNKSTKGRT